MLTRFGGLAIPACSLVLRIYVVGQRYLGNPVTAGNYNYDGDGNLIQDVSKDLVNITYDYRDLPTEIEFNLPANLVLEIMNPISGTRTYRALQTITAQNNFVVASGGDVTFTAGQRIELKPGFHAQSGSQFHAQIDPNIGNQPGNAISYTYNQAGNRVAKSTSDNITLHYIRGSDGQTITVLDENDSPLFYNIAGLGKLVPGGNDVSYYYLTDHLGSMRVIIQNDGTVAGYTDYYPFGMMMPGRVMTNLSHDFYKYNGKQLDDDYGLNWHDYGWRPYDGEIGRWPQPDPLADSLPSWSAYVYVANSPLLFVDPNGTDMFFYNSDSSVIATIVTGTDDHQYIYTGLGYTTDNPLVIDIPKLLELSGLSSIDAVGVSFTGDFAFGGGAGGGTEFVYFLSGENKDELHQYILGQVTLGFGIGAGATDLVAWYNGKGTPTADSWSGWTNSYSVSAGIVEGNYFWSNVEAKPDAWPRMYGRQLLWEGFSLGGVYSGKIKIGAMWKATKYTHWKKW